MKMDPSARKMSNYQWEQAYAAYKRVRGHRNDDKKETGESVEVSQRMSDDERLLVLRQNTVYHRARKYVDWVFFIALVFIVLVFLVAMFKVLSSGFFVFFLVSTVQLIFSLGLAVLLRELVHVLIDIPDIALAKSYERLPKEPQED